MIFGLVSLANFTDNDVLHSYFFKGSNTGAKAEETLGAKQKGKRKKIT
jgi:hypothetical protein